jgi:enoyl-CoA hydratase
MDGPEIICERRGACGFALFNRPAALNALTPGMIRALRQALEAWARDPSILRVVARGAGDRAFCAGGDIRLIYEQGLAGQHEAQLAFWRDEYRLNQFIARYPKPYVALMDGFVMGGGVGVAIHGSHRIAGDRLAFAMPEVAIGFFPDVGATFFLPRLPGGMGAYIGLTGARVGAGDALAAGLANAFVPSARFDALAEALGGTGDTDAIVARFAADPPAPALARHRALIDDCFGAPDVAAVLARLDAASASGDAFAQATAATLRKHSPTSLAIAFRQTRPEAGRSVEEALRLEYRVVSRVLRAPDFYEGVRAAIIERGAAPRWRPARLEDVDPAVIDACFAPLGSAELDFDAEDRA